MSSDASQAFTDRLRADLKTAMQARARDEAAVLRALIGIIDNAQAVPVDPAHKPSDSVRFGEASEVARRPLSSDKITALLRREIAEREAAAQEIERLGRADKAEDLRAQIAIVARYLP